MEEKPASACQEEGKQRPAKASTDNPSSCSSSSSSSSGSAAADRPNSSSSTSSSSRTTTGSPQREQLVVASGGGGGVPIKVPAAAESSEAGMSESYHEIFDSLMPPETAKAKVMDLQSQEKTSRDVSSPQPALPDSSASATNYLTSKLVEDSIRWQESHPLGCVTNSPGVSPFASPSRRPLQATSPFRSKAAAAAGNMGSSNSQSLDPHCLLELERSAKHLATSVDEMTEQLSTVLHGISSLTVDTMETYRDGVCKTCDAVDNNIKTMYQVMAKVEELNKSMAPAYTIAEEVKDIKRVLDIMEANVK